MSEMKLDSSVCINMLRCVVCKQPGTPIHNLEGDKAECKSEYSDPGLKIMSLWDAEVCKKKKKSSRRPGSSPSELEVHSSKVDLLHTSSSS